MAGLLRARRAGIPIVQRLDGMNWLHKHFGMKKVGLRHYLRAEYGNWLLALIRGRLADRIVYQSEFSRLWWDRVYGKGSAEQRVIHNGVDLDVFNPAGDSSPPEDFWRVLLVEGSLMGGYEHGISAAVDAIRELAGMLLIDKFQTLKKPIELAIAGKVDQSVKSYWEKNIHHEGVQSDIQLRWHGLLPHNKIPSVDRSAHVLYSSDINPACPNSVIEALACGLPVVSFATGALSEIVKDQAGLIVPYGGDPWKLDPPDTTALADAMLRVLSDQAVYRRSARRRAEAEFGLEPMVDAYLEMLGVKPWCI